MFGVTIPHSTTSGAHVLLLLSRDKIEILRKISENCAQFWNGWVVKIKRVHQNDFSVHRP